MASEASGTRSQLRWEEHRRTFEGYLRGLRFTPEPRLAGLEEAMRYSMLAGGKRVRPTLCMEVAWVFGAEPAHVLPSAAAIELIHTYSLIHDDLPAMDDDDFRRGRPTAHKKFGEAMAILAGDAFFGEALTLITVNQEGSCEKVLEVVRELADATGVNGMVGGQYLDVTGHTDDLRHLHELKTGRLIGASVVCVLLLEGASETATVAYRRFAGELGVLFQIVDDILDVTGTDADLGKSHGTDERHGRRTYVSEYGLEGARELAEASHAEAREHLAAAAGSEDATELEQITDFIYTRTS